MPSSYLFGPRKGTEILEFSQDLPGKMIQRTVGRPIPWQPGLDLDLDLDLGPKSIMDAAQTSRSA